MATILAEQWIILKNISWQMFESLLAAKGEDPNTRLAYDRGLLEIMSPLMPHEHTKRLLEDCIKILVDELDFNVKSVGSMTCKREDLERGLEPDSGF
jgi:Uma2 family endonuclease